MSEKIELECIANAFVDGKLIKASKKPIAFDKEVARRLLASNRFVLPSEDNAEESEDKGPSTVKELTAALEKLEVTIPDGAKKADLQKLYQEATSEE